MFWCGSSGSVSSVVGPGRVLAGAVRLCAVCSGAVGPGEISSNAILSGAVLLIGLIARLCQQRRRLPAKVPGFASNASKVGVLKFGITRNKLNKEGKWVPKTMKELKEELLATQALPGASVLLEHRVEKSKIELFATLAMPG